MRNRTFRRLIVHWSAQQAFKAHLRVTSKSSVKANGKAVGLVMKNSKMRPQVGLERQFRSY